MSLILDGTNGLSDVDGSAATPAIRGSDANTGVFFGTDIVGVSTGGSERVRVDASGNVGIGTSSPQANLQIGNADVSSRSIVVHTANNGDARLRFREGGTVSSGFNEYSFGMLGASNAMTWESQGLGEVARIDSSGNLLVGTTTGGKRINVSGGSNVDIGYFETNTSQGWSVGPVNVDSGRFNWYNDNATANRMFLTVAGALFNSTGTYGTISDVSLKENIVDATPKLADVMRLRVRNFNLKSDPEKRKVIGVVAQELEEVFPGLIEEVGDRVALEDGSFEEKPVKAVKYSVLTTILVKAIQEQQAIITALTARVEALEGAQA
jgi:hypothetical protein